jgi:hypothetical protein
VYGFAVLDYSNLVMKPHDSWADLDNDFYGKVTEFKKYGIKVTVAIGGWNDSEGDKYSRLVNSPAARYESMNNNKKFNFFKYKLYFFLLFSGKSSSSMLLSLSCSTILTVLTWTGSTLAAGRYSVQLTKPNLE